MSGIDEWLNIIRREAHSVAFHGQEKNTLVATSYNPKLYAIKGVLVPSMVETGWIGIGTAQTGGGAGHFVGPRVGTADDLKGDKFDIDFENGDPNTPMARPRMSLQTNPPQVQSGEVMTLDENGSSTYYKQDKSVVFTHGVNGATSTWDTQGNHTVDTKGAPFTTNVGQTSVQKTSSQIVTKTPTKIFTQVVHLGAGG